ncbi:MAG TPA: alpha/beta hydrolase [Alphaproteobacteria bacterium]|nr:alpha/beta hydrolase [Alphaproteobacteria bacterium]
MSNIVFQGPAGRIEAKFFENKDNPSAPIALVLHPHPMHGGTMNNKATYKIYESFAKNGFSVLRFNFRGVGHSEGSFDNGEGELSDAAAALDWIHNLKPQAQQIWLSGFSFGAWIAMKLIMRRPDIDNFITVAPPIGNPDYDFSSFNLCPTSGLVISAELDDIVNPNDIETFLKQVQRVENAKINYAKIPNAHHLFTEHLDQLGKLLDQYIKMNKTKNM